MDSESGASSTCKNCGAVLAGAYCASCGQAANVEIPSLWAVIVDFLDDLYSFDSRLWRSMIPLLLRPGQLTIEYLRGRRIRYVPPLRMYLVLSVLFFLLASVAEDLSVDTNGGDAADRELSTEVREEIADDLAAEGINVGDTFSCDPATWEGFFESPQIRARFAQACERIVDDSGEALMREFIGNIPVMLFVFIPFAAGYVKMLYPLARKKYVEHLLFLFHTNSFFFLNAIVILLLSTVSAAAPALSVPVGILIACAVIYQILYPYFAMRRVYRNGRLVTFFKYVLLLIGYFIFLTITFLVGLLYTALTI